MFIGFFRNSNPSSFVLLPIIAIGLWASGFLSQSHFVNSHHTLLFDFFAKLFAGLPFVNTSLALLLLIAEAFLINYIVNENEITERRSFLPALAYIVFMSNDNPMLTLNPVLFANFFVLLAINRLLASYRKETALSEAFDAGFYLSVATLFYFPCAVLLPMLGIGLIIFRALNFREWIVSFIGVLLPYLFVFTYCYWFNGITDFIKDIQSYFVLPEKSSFDFSESFYFMFVTGFLICLFSINKLISSFIAASQKTKKNLLLIIWLFVLILISFILSPELKSPYFSLLAIPLTIFAANYFLYIKKIWWAEILLIVFIITILINNFSKYL